MKVSEAVTRYLREGRSRGQFSPSTVSTYRLQLGAFVAAIGDPDLRDLSQRQVRKWWGELEGCASYTRARLSTVRGLCEWAVLHGHLATDPTLGLKAPRRPEPRPRNLPRQDVDGLLSACDDTRARACVVLMVQLGLRRMEVAGLDLGDVDWIDRSIKVRGKGGKVRVIALTDQAEAAIDAYLTEMPARSGPLIRGMDGHGPLTPTRIYQIVSAAFYASGVKRAPGDGRTPHALRHTAATDMLRAGADVVHVQRALGHADLSTTQRYLGHSAEGIRGAMEGRWYGPRAS